MLLACIITNILAIALPSLRISPLLLIRIATIALLYAAALSFNVVYIQSIGSGIGIFSGLFHVTLISQNIISPLLLSSLLPVKPVKTSRSLTQAARKEFTLSKELTEILVGLLLGDLFAEKQKTSVNIRLIFRQSIIHPPQ